MDQIGEVLLAVLIIVCFLWLFFWLLDKVAKHFIALCNLAFGWFPKKKWIGDSYWLLIVLLLSGCTPESERIEAIWPWECTRTGENYKCVRVD